MVERKHYHLLDAAIGDQSYTFFGVVEQARGAIGSDNFARVRIESEDSGDKFQFPGDFDDAVEDAAMRKVNAIEVSNGDGRWARG